MNDYVSKVENAVAAIRVSSVRQGTQGDSPEAQKEQIENFAKAHNINVKKFFIFLESASKDEQPVQEAIDYCINSKNDIQLFIIKSIDRFTRGGSYLYDGLKIGGPQTVHHMFRNKFYMGILASKVYPEEIRGQHTPMVTQEQFYTVQAILDGRCVSKPLMPKNTRDNTDFPLRRIVRCGKCGTPFTGAWSKHHKYAYYFCRNRCINNSVPVSDLHNGLSNLLFRIKVTDKGINLFCSLLLKTYNKHLSKLQKTRKSSDEEIAKLNATRQVLVEKNIAGIYSDEIFKEQNAIIEERLIAAYASKSEELLEKYDINKIVNCVKTKLSDLPNTYSTSNLSQIRCLLGSIFVSGFSWGYPGCSNYQISPTYQAIREADKPDVQDSCRAWIRTKINGSKVRCPTIRRLDNVFNFYYFVRFCFYSICLSTSLRSFRNAPCFV